jgi:type VI protein secretion system component VasF
MKLLEICEPIFLYVCVLNRVAKLNAKAPGYEYETVRPNLDQMFGGMLSKAGADFQLQEQIRKIELPLMFFVDSYISESRLDFAGRWNSERLAFKRNEHAGDDKFFKLLDDTLREQTLRDKSAEASERLEVYYVCLGLGFHGSCTPERVRQYMDEIARQITPSMERNWNEDIIKEQFANSTNLVAPPSRKLVFVGIFFLCLMFATVITYIWMFREASQNLSVSINSIINNSGQ